MRTTQDEAAPATRAYLLGPGEGRHVWFLGSLMTVKADAAGTGGAISLIEQVAPPGFASPLHLHHGEDEPMYILEGRFTFWIGDEVVPAAPGTLVYLPRGVAHCFRYEGREPGRLLQLTLPAGLEQGFVEMGSRAPGAQLPPPPDGAPGPEQFARMAQISARYSVEILGPPPGAPGFPLADPGGGSHT
jgi:mannose-6-phosphate isomerase-like protein (cupin superfamily)